MDDNNLQPVEKDDGGPACENQCYPCNNCVTKPHCRQCGEYIESDTGFCDSCCADHPNLAKVREGYLESLKPENFLVFGDIWDCMIKTKMSAIEGIAMFLIDSVEHGDVEAGPTLTYVMGLIARVLAAKIPARVSLRWSSDNENGYCGPKRELMLAQSEWWEQRELHLQRAIDLCIEVCSGRATLEYWRIPECGN